ncbi:unnamed protein product [Chrysoparadoxa australica]
MAGAGANSGQNAETVYRDKRGRRLEMLEEFMRQQDNKDGKQQREEKAKMEWGRGLVQKQASKDYAAELEGIKDQPFARTQEHLDVGLKEEIRADDPMAAYMAKKQAKKVKKLGKPLKPVYKGPAPKPNRFRIPPGYRWDGVDRGNNWEETRIKMLQSTSGKNAAAYRMATADM